MAWNGIGMFCLVGWGRTMDMEYGNETVFLSMYQRSRTNKTSSNNPICHFTNPPKTVST